MSTDTLHADFWVATDLTDRTLVFGRGDVVWGDTVDPSELASLVSDLAYEVATGRCERCDGPIFGDGKFVPTAMWRDRDGSPEYDGYEVCEDCA